MAGSSVSAAVGATETTVSVLVDVLCSSGVVSGSERSVHEYVRVSVRSVVVANGIVCPASTRSVADSGCGRVPSSLRSVPVLLTGRSPSVRSVHVAPRSTNGSPTWTDIGLSSASTSAGACLSSTLTVLVLLVFCPSESLHSYTASYTPYSEGSVLSEVTLANVVSGPWKSRSSSHLAGIASS